MIFRDKTPHSRVFRIMAVISHSPVIILFESIFVSIFRRDHDFPLDELEPSGVDDLAEVDEALLHAQLEVHQGRDENRA